MYCLLSRPAGGINLKWNEAEHVLPPTPEELQVLKLCNRFWAASIVGVVVFKYIGIFLNRSW